MVTSFEQQGIRTVFEGIEEGWQTQAGGEIRGLNGAGLRAGAAGACADQFRGFGKDVRRRRQPARQDVGQPGSGPSARPAKAFGRRTAP